MEEKLKHLKLDDADLIRLAMRQQNLGLSSMTSPTEVENQKALGEQKCAKAKKESFDKGYALCFSEIEKRSIDGFFISDDDIPPLSVDTFKMNEVTKESLENMEFWKEYVDNPTELQSLLGYTNDMLLGIYHLSCVFYENKQHQEAIKSYTFLCLLNPGISSFWLGLGLALEENNELPEAMEAFEKAAEVKPSEFTPYLGLIRCGEKLHDLAHVILQLKEACKNPALESDANAALEYLSSLVKIGG